MHPQPTCWQGSRRGPELWCCVSSVQQDLKYPCVNTVFSTNLKHRPIQATVEKSNSIPAKSSTHMYVWIFSPVFSRYIGTFWILYKCAWDLGISDNCSPDAPAPAAAHQHFIVVSSGTLDVGMIFFEASEHVCSVVEPCIISLTLLKGLPGLYYSCCLCMYKGCDHSLKSKVCALQCTHISAW